MGRRFTPVPDDATACCCSGAERLCVLALYERGHDRRWQPFKLSVREFAKWGPISVGAAAALLKALEVAGLISREHDEHQSRADTVTVFDPTLDLDEQQHEHGSEHQDERPDDENPGGDEHGHERHREHFTRDGDTRVGDREPDHEGDQDRGSLAYAREEGQAEPVPTWARKLDPPPGLTRLDLVAVVVGCKEAVEGIPPNPERCKTDARDILGLWADDGHRQPADFVADFRLVAEAARDCPDRLFARDVRGEGWEGAADRHRDIDTLCVRKAWSKRLRAARAWDAAGRPAGANGHATGPPARAAPETLFDRLQRIAAKGESPPRFDHPTPPAK